MAALDEPKGWIALFVGLVVAALGVIPLLNQFGVIAFNLPEFILNIIPAIAIWLIAGVAFFLFIDSFMEDDAMRVISIIVALALLAVGVIQILFKFGVIGWGIPFLTDTVYLILFVVEGLFLIIAAFAMY